MSPTSHWGVSPQQSIEAEADRRGKATFVAECIALLRGEDADAALVFALGGPAADRVLAGRADERLAYWLRVWAARGLFWAWDAAATDAVVAALSDDAWRVREMACRVIAKHQVAEAFDEVGSLRTDAVKRVRVAASRAVAVLTEIGA
ncbi:MAG: hypothetical protein ABI586_00060 [Candidatus Nanopelagicales bacterium]